MDEMTTWRKEITEALKYNGESWENIISITLSEKELDAEFDDSWGGYRDSLPFMAWTEKKVYFPVCYEGNMEARSVSRNPDGKAIKSVDEG